ncbi:MAG TPA: glycosyl hydrolase family 18 protein [Bacteroidia bacterium]|jgi:spore germination protein YaaH|nr:glycosyl hydrolase family 18 protein [Bacteroidia bacterium]
MKKFYTFLFSLLVLVSISQTVFKSVMQEQSEFYQKYKFTNDRSWDSLNSVTNSHTPSSKNSSACSLKKKVYGWHPYWNGSTYTSYNWTMLSDFCYFDYSVSPTTGQNTNASFAWSTSTAVTTAKANGVKIHICASLFASHATFWATPSAQTTFINNMVSLLNSRGGNGVNIDFEGMGSADKTPFKNFIVNLKNALVAANPNYELSVALYAVDWSTSFDIPNLNPVLDNFIIMGYDYYWSGSTTAGPEAPLYNFETSYNYTLTKSVTYYLKQGATPSKLLLGLPYYGREWETVSSLAPSATSGTFTTTRLYNYVKSNSTTYSASAKKWESNCYNPCYSYLSSGNWRQCWIDDIYSMGRKFDMVNQRGIGGVGIWALGYDNGYNDYWQLLQDKFSTCEIKPCTDSLFDMGGPTRNYYDNEAYTFSISPNGIDKVQLQFKSFATEMGYDSLFIYNGPTTASPLMGAYTGSVTSPGTVTSTGTVITLRFKSDGATVAAGWKLIYNCVSITDVKENANENGTNLFPNPTSGVFEIKTNSITDCKILIFNSIGKIVYQSVLSSEKIIDLSDLNLNSGIYFVEINSAEQKLVKKLVYQR